MARYALHPWERGLDCLWQGVRDFYTHRILWRYMAVPLAAALLTDLAVGLAAFYRLLPWLEQHWTAWQESSALFRWACLAAGYVARQLLNVAPETLGRICFWLAVGYGMSLIGLAVFSFIGGFFFSAMCEMYELRVLKLPPRPRLELRRKLLLLAVAFWHTLMLSAILLVMGGAMLILPVIGFLAAATFGGYCYSLFFMSGAGGRRGWSIHRMNFCFAGRRDVLYGFGMTVFFLMQLPFVAVLLMPGFYLGGALLVEREI